jgi:hypothetical protein
LRICEAYRLDLARCALRAQRESIGCVAVDERSFDVSKRLVGRETITTRQQQSSIHMNAGRRAHVRVKVKHDLPVSRFHCE